MRIVVRKKRSLVSNILNARRLLQTSSRKKLCPASCAMHRAKHSSKTEKRLSGEAEVTLEIRSEGGWEGPQKSDGATAATTAPTVPHRSRWHLSSIADHHNLRAALVVRYSFGLVAKPITHCLRSSGKPSSLHAGVQAGVSTGGGLGDKM